jgi:hypothetical protein
VYGPTLIFVSLSLTVTPNDTVVADVGVPLMVSVPPAAEEERLFEGRPVTVHE